MSKKIEELLAVLDMPKDSQNIWLVAKDIIKSSMDERGAAMMDESLADLAFRTRDEVNKGDDVFVFGNAVKLVFIKVFPQLKPPKTYHSKLVMWRWLAEKAQPIHFIIAALIAKQMEKEEDK